MMKRSDIKGSDSLEEAMLKQVEEYGIRKGIEKGVRKIIFQLFQNGFDVLQVSKMLTMDEAIIGNLRAAFEEQQRESEGEGKTDETHQEKRKLTMERSDSKGSDSLEEAMLKQVEEYGFQKGFKQGFEQEFKQSIEKGVRKTIFQLFQNGFDVLQVSKMLTMDEAIIGNLRAAFEEQQRESEGEGKTDETHQEKKVIDDEEE